MIPLSNPIKSRLMKSDQNPESADLPDGGKGRILVGITGNIGCGKSTVAEYLGLNGIGLINGDNLGKQVINEDRDFNHWLENRFGRDFFSDGILNRKKLGQRVFNDPVARQDLDRKIWPEIRNLLESSIRKSFDQFNIVVVDAALIFEWNDQSRYDLTVTVLADPAIAIQRAADRLEINCEEATRRFLSQLPQTEKARRSDIILLNDRDLKDLYDQCDSLLNILQEFYGSN